MMSLTSHASLGLLNKRETNTLLLGEGDNSILLSTNAENVAETGSEDVTLGISDVGDLVGTGMVLDVLKDTDTTNVITTGTENLGVVLKLDNAVDLVGLQIELHGIVDLDVGVREADGSSVVSNDVGNLVLANALLGHLAQLELSFFVINSVGLEAALNIVKDAEVLTGLPDGNDIHEAEGVSVISSFFVVNFDVGALVLHDLDAFLVGESELKTVLQKN
jgi:hypothetical protein